MGPLPPPSSLTPIQVRGISGRSGGGGGHWRGEGHGKREGEKRAWNSWFTKVWCLERVGDEVGGGGGIRAGERGRGVANPGVGPARGHAEADGGGGGGGGPEGGGRQRSVWIGVAGGGGCGVSGPPDG